MARGAGAIIGIILVVFALIFGIGYGVQSLAMLDASQNMTDSPYEDTYNASRATTEGEITLMSHLPYVLIIGGVVVAVGLIAMNARRRW